MTDENAPGGSSSGKAGMRTGAASGDAGAEGGGVAGAAKNRVPTTIVRDRTGDGAGSTGATATAASAPRSGPNEARSVGGAGLADRDGPMRATTGELATGTVPPTSSLTIVDRRRRQRRLLVAFCALSLGVHLGLVVGFIFAPKPARPAIDLDEAIVKTRLVKLGKERPPDWLPRLDAAPAQPVEQKRTPKPDDKKEQEKPDKDSKDKPTAADILKDFDKDNRPKDLKDIIKDRLGAQTDEGKKDGDKDGTALDGEIKKTYFSSVIAAIQRRMEISSTITDEERIRLKATLQIKVGSDGEVLEAKIVKSSGSSVYDNDVITAAKRSSPLPAPPPAAKELMADGVSVNFCPSGCG